MLGEMESVLLVLSDIINVIACNPKGCREGLRNKMKISKEI